MKTKSKVILAIGGGMVLLLAAAAIWLFSQFGQASYQPGRLAAGLTMLKTDGAAVNGALAVNPAEGRFALEVEPGVTIRGLVDGAAGGAPVIVLHGGPGFPSTRPWAGLEAFKANRRFWYPHQRGSGWSDRPVDRFASQNFPANVAELDAKLGLAIQIMDIERLRRALGVERIDLVGHSFGGLIACLYAIEFPEHAGRLLLIAPAAMVQFPAASGGLYELIRQALPADRLSAYEAWLKDFFDYGRLFQRSESELSALNAGVMPFFGDALAAGGGSNALADNDPALTGGWMMPAIFFSMGQSHDWRQAFAGIKSPVTLVAGDADLAWDTRDAGQYGVIPGLLMESVPGADHFLAQEARFAAIRAVRDWMTAPFAAGKD